MKKSIFCSLIISLLVCSFHVAKAAKSKTPKHIPDLTKGEKWEKPEADGPYGRFGYFNLGPTGILGFMIGGDKDATQIMVDIVIPNSPAAGKFKQGDVILGINGKKFEKTEKDLCEVFGAAINEAEKEENKGKMSFMVWRDKNWQKRHGAVDMKNVDVDKLFNNASTDLEGVVEVWMSDEQKEKSFQNMQESKAPMDPEELTIEINVPVLGTFSETSPYNCPKTEKIIERGLVHIRKKMKEYIKTGRGGMGRYYLRAHVLMATGDPDDLELVKKAVRRDRAFKPDRFISTWGAGMASWYCGYQLVFGCEYYMRTGDNYILPALREIATKTAMGQTYGGSWSHSFSARSFNMGKVNMRASGYGALNAAAGQCFLGIVMAKKIGITNKYIERAIERSCRFYGSIAEIGGVPYGMHPAANYADSNGKGGAPTFAFQLLGKKTDADYYSKCMSVAAWWRHGGHCGGEWGAIWRPIGANAAGPEAVQLYHKNRRNFYAMSRCYDGKFLLHWPSGGPFMREDPTALYMLRYLATTRGNTIITGKDPMKEIWLTPKTKQDVIDGNGGDKNIPEWSNEVLYAKCSTFYPRMRDAYAKELGKRYKEGKADDAVEKALEFLKDKEPRKRAAGVLILGKCGEDVVKKNLKSMLAMFDDPRQFVRINAVRALIPYFQDLEGDLAEPLMRLVTRKEYWDMVNDNNNIPTYVFNALYPKQPKRGPKLFQTKFAEHPFEYGLDPHLTRETLERAFQWDPGRMKVLKKVAEWDRNQVMQFAGPIVFGAEFLQMNDMMFAGGALSAGRRILKKFNMNRELLEAVCYNLYLLDSLPRSFYPRAHGHSRAMSGKTPYDPITIKDQKGAARFLLPSLRRYLIEHPLASRNIDIGKGRKKVMKRFDLFDTIMTIEKDKNTPVEDSIYGEVKKVFLKGLAEKPDDKAKIEYCRLWLNPDRKTYYMQMAAMSSLVKLIGPEACADLLPYLNHDLWRWRKHSRKLVKEMGSDATKTLLALYEKNKKDDLKAAGIMAVLNSIGDNSIENTALKAMQEGGEKTQGEAVKALVTVSGFKHLDKIVDHLKTLDSDYTLDGFEKALLTCKGNKNDEELISKTLKSNLRKSKKYARRTIYYVLAMIGGKPNLDFLKRVTTTKNEGDFQNVVESVSYSRDPGATKWIEDVITENQGTKRSFVAATFASRRMVLSDSSKGVGHCDPKETIPFARQVLKSVRDTNLIRCLAYYPCAESSDLMLKYMRKGPEKVTVAASQGIIDCAARMSKDDPAEERKAVAEGLRNVIEYLTVTKLRIPENQRHKHSGYYEAKEKVEKAGQAMLRIYDPEEEQIEDIDDDDLDI